MKTFLRPLVLAASLAASPAAAQTDYEILMALEHYGRGQCFMWKADEVQGDEGRHLIGAAAISFRLAISILREDSPYPGDLAWRLAHSYIERGEGRLRWPEFAPGAPSFPSSMFCEGMPVS